MKIIETRLFIKNQKTRNTYKRNQKIHKYKYYDSINLLNEKYNEICGKPLISETANSDYSFPIGTQKQIF